MICKQKVRQLLEMKNILPILFLMVFAFSAVANAAPSINAWSSSGGNIQNKDDAQDTMYLAQQGNSITFSITASGATSYIWLINKADQNVNTNTFTWSVPNEKGLWEINVEVSDGTGSVYKEWIISTFNQSEAPEFFDSFTDGQMTGARTNDPWGRALPNWETGSNSLTGTGFIVVLSGASQNIIKNTDIAYGTYVFWLKFPDYDPYTSAGQYTGFKLHGSTKGYGTSLVAMHKTHEEHDYFELYETDLPYEGHRRLDRNSLAQAPAYDTVPDGEWHKVTLIHTKDGYWYLYYDDELEPEKIDNNEAFDAMSSMEININPGLAYVDAVQIFKDRYVFPGTGRIEYGSYPSHWYWDTSKSKLTSYWSWPVFRTGISVYGEATLNEIYTKINNPSIFSYDGIIGGKPTYTAYTDLVIREGATLRVNNERLRIHSNSPGEHIFRVKLGAQLNVLNSIIDSDNDNYFIWAFTSTPLQDMMAENIEAVKPPTHPTFYTNVVQNRMFQHYIFDGRVIIKNSVVNNSGNFWIEGPLELVIKDTNFTNLVQVNFGEYRTAGSNLKVRKDPIERSNFAKAFGTQINMNVVNYTIENVKFSAKPGQTLPINITLEGGMDVIPENYLRNVVLENARIESKVGWRNDPHEGVATHDIDSDVLIVNPNNTSLVSPDNERERVSLAYYLDVLIQDNKGAPIQGSTVVVENEVDPIREPAQNIRSANRPVYTHDAAGLFPSGALSEGGWYDKQIDIRRMYQPKNIIDLLKIGKDDDSNGIIYEIIGSSSIDLLANGIRNPIYDGNGRLTSFEYFIENNVKTDPYVWYRVDNIVYDSNGLITGYHKNGYGTKEAGGRDTTLGNFDYQINYNYLNGVVSNYTVTRTVSPTWSGEPSWKVSKTINAAAITGSNGHTALPSNGANTLVVVAYKQTMSGITPYTYKVTAYYGGKKATLTGINPSDSWYRTNENVSSVTVKCNIDTGTCTLVGPESGSTTGIVNDTKGNSLSGATVSTGGASNQTNINGRFFLSNVAVGNQQITASKLGYVSQTKQVNVIKDSIVNLDFTLSIAVDPAITSISPSNLTPSQDEGTTNTYGVTVDQPVISKWLLDNVQQSNSSQTYTKSWSYSDAGTHNITYLGENTNGTVSKTWIVTVNNIVDIIPPVITNLISNVASSSAVITWTTNEIATSQMEYGFDASYGSMTPLDSNLVINHSVTLTGLTNNTTYHYRVMSKDADNNLATSRDYNITTLNINSSIVGLWHFDENGGVTAADNSGKGNHGAIYGAVWTTGILRSALQYNGLDNNIQVADSDTLEGMPQLTVEAWIYYQGGKSGARIVDKWKAGGGLYQLYKFGDTDNIGGYLAGIMDDTDTGVAYTLNAWQHIAMVYNGSATKWYKNGSLIYIRSGLSGNIGISNDPLYIGGRSSTSGNFNGKIDEVKILNKALSDIEIKDDYEGKTSFNPAPSITSFSPDNLTPSYAVNSSATFKVTTDKAVSSTWYLNGANQNNNTQVWSHTWDIPGQYNVTYLGTNSNGSVRITWNVSVIISPSPYDVNRDGYINNADIEVIRSHFGEVTVSPYPPYDVTRYGIVDIYDVTLVSTKV